MEPNSSDPIEPTRSPNKLFTIAGIAVLLGAAALGWYFLYFIKTPAYSLELIRESVQKHDYATFNKHVDTESLLSRGIDDLMSATLDAETDTDESIKKLADGFFKMIKPALVNMMKDGIERYVETGKFTDEAKEDGAQHPVTLSPSDLTKKTGLDNLSFKGIKYTKKDGKTATVGTTVFDAQLEKEFVLDIQMRELDDGSWQVAEISNFKDYMAALEARKKEKLAELNQPLIEELNKNVQIGEPTCSITGSGFSRALSVAVPAQFSPEKPVAELHGLFTIRDADDKVLFHSPFLIGNLSEVSGSTSLHVNLNLNPFIPGQNQLLKTPLDSVKKEITISKLKFADGSVTAIYTALPESAK